MPFEPGAFAEAVAESSGGDAPPDAIYEAELVKSDIVTRRSDGWQWVKFTWRVISGPHRDAQWDSMHILERYKADGERNPGLVFTVQTLRTMGVDVDNVRTEEQLRDAALELEGKGYAVEVQTKGAYTNTNVKGQLHDYAPSLPHSGGDAPAYGQQRAPANAIMGVDNGGVSAPPQTLAQAGEPIRQDVERTGESDVTTPADVAAFDRSQAPKRGSVDPETGEEIPF